jgi:hypothetical protein
VARDTARCLTCLYLPPGIPTSCTAAALLLHCLQVDPGYLSQPTAVEFATESGLTAYMNYYPPANKVGWGAVAPNAGVEWVFL